jgi:hypothetical protein
LTQRWSGSYGGGSRSKGEDSEKGETEDRLSHRCKCGGKHRRARVRV